MSKPDRHLFTVVKGGLQPADEITKQRLRGVLRIGQEVFVELKSPRNPRFHRLAHALGNLITENIDSFEGLDAHRALKRLQLESGVGCEEVAYRLHGQMVLARLPKSMSFASMSEAEFREVITGLCRHLAKTYWPECTAEEIEQMAECMPEVA